MRSFFEFFAKRNTLANVFTVMIILVGMNAFLSIRRAQYPTVDIGEVKIFTSYPGAAPEDVELNVTNKLEDELKGVTGIKSLASYSRENISIILIKIEADVTDTKKVKDDIREAVSRVTDFPPEVTDAPFVLEINTSMMPVIEVGLSSVDMPYGELREYARVFEKKLKNVSGVSNVTRYGYRDREVQIEVSPEQLRNYNLSLRDIIGAIKNRNIRATGGSMESYTSEKNVVTMAQFRDPLEVGEVIVRTPVTVNDLATLNNGFEDEKVISRMNGKPAISFEVLKSETADIIRTVKAIKKLMKEEQEYLPDNVEILFSSDVSRQVASQFAIVRNNAIIGLALVLILLAIFLNIRTAFWVAIGIPVSVFGVVALLPLFDVFLDTITLTAMIIVIGIIVDDGIIVSEHITTRRELGDTPLEAAVNGIHEVFKPVVTTILTTILAFAPMFYMSGIMGKFVYVIPLTITLSLLVSFAEIVLALPAHLTPGMKRLKVDPGSGHGGGWFKPLMALFDTYLRKLLRFRYLVIFASIVILAGALLYAQNFMSFVLFPSTGADKFFISLELPVGTSLRATSDKAKYIENIIQSLPEKELDSFTARVGIFGDAHDMTEAENGSMITVVLSPYSRRDRTADEIVKEMRQKIETVFLKKGGLKKGSYKLSFMIEAGGPPVGAPVTIRIAGTSDTIRAKLASDVMEFLETIDGVRDIEQDVKPGKEQVEIKIDYEELARQGLTVADIAQNVRIAYDGEVVSNIRYGDEDLDFRVQLSPEARDSLEYLRNLSIPNRQEKFIPLKSVATLELGPGTSHFYHYDSERTIMVTSGIDQKKTTPQEVTQAVIDHFDLHKDYPGMRFAIGGEAQETGESMVSLFRIFIISIIGMYLLLLLLFNSMTQPLLVILAIPFGIVGVIITFALHGTSFSFLAIIGIIGLGGIVVNDSLVLVNHVNEKRKKHPDMPVLELVTSGTVERLRPIIMTTLTTVAGLLPLAYGLGGRDLYMAPMALALGWGLLFATPITLILLPSIYLVGDDIKKVFRKGQS